MSIKIEITDPHLLEPELVLITIDFLCNMNKIKNPPDTSFKAGDVVHYKATHTNTGLSTESQETTPVKLDTFEPPELDSKGLPWDKRIHSRTKSKNQDGTWKLQRGAFEKVIEKVQAEREIMKTNVTPPMPAVQPYIEPGFKTPAVPPPPVSPIDPIAPVIDYPALMNKITLAMSKGTLTRPQIHDVLQNLGAPPIHILGTRPDLIPQVNKMVDLIIQATEGAV